MRSMYAPTYTFRLRSDGCEIDDNSGVALTDNASAYQYARTVARELMRSRELQTRYWLLEVYRDGEGPLFGILFATVDPTLDHLRRELRSLVERVSEKKRALKDTIHGANLTLRESQSLLARSRGKPYLIAENGEITIRGFDRPTDRHWPDARHRSFNHRVGDSEHTGRYLNIEGLCGF